MLDLESEVQASPNARAPPAITRKCAQTIDCAASGTSLTARVVRLGHRKGNYRQLAFNWEGRTVHGAPLEEG